MRRSLTLKKEGVFINVETPKPLPPGFDIVYMGGLPALKAGQRGESGIFALIPGSGETHFVNGPGATASDAEVAEYFQRRKFLLDGAYLIVTGRVND